METPTLQDVSLILGSAVAVWGLLSWKREHRWRRQLELAEETLALFYEARDAIAYMRGIFSFSTETEGIKREAGESDEKYEARKLASVVFKRYNDNQELFGKIHALRYRFMAQIGKEQAEPFSELWRIRNEIFASARSLSRLWPSRRFRDEQTEDKHWKDIERHEAVIYGADQDEDQIAKRLDALVDRIEATCKAIISGKRTIWRVLCCLHRTPKQATNQKARA